MRGRFQNLILALLLVVGALVMGGVQAQTRGIAATAKVGVLEMTGFPEARIDGTPVRFGAGARILNKQNRIVLPASIAAPTYIAYVSDFQGLLLKVWLIDESEAKAIVEAQRKAGN